MNPELEKLRAEANYSAGVADSCAKILAMFDSQLTEHFKDWLHKERQAHRQKTAESLEEALEILKDKL